MKQMVHAILWMQFQKCIQSVMSLQAKYINRKVAWAGWQVSFLNEYVLFRKAINGYKMSLAKSVPFSLAFGMYAFWGFVRIVQCYFSIDNTLPSRPIPRPIKNRPDIKAAWLLANPRQIQPIKQGKQESKVVAFRPRNPVINAVKRLPQIWPNDSNAAANKTRLFCSAIWVHWIVCSFWISRTSLDSQ